MLGDSRDGQGLSRKRLPQERPKRWRQRIVWPLQRGIHLDETGSEFLRESSKIFVIGIHGGTPDDGSVQTKNGRVTGRWWRRSGILRRSCGYSCGESDPSPPSCLERLLRAGP